MPGFTCTVQSNPRSRTRFQSFVGIGKGKGTVKVYHAISRPLSGDPFSCVTCHFDLLLLYSWLSSPRGQNQCFVSAATEHGRLSIKYAVKVARRSRKFQENGDDVTRTSRPKIANRNFG